MEQKTGDYVVLALSVLVIAGFALQVYSQDFDTPVVSIESDGTKWVYPIDEDREIAIEGPLGETVVEIKDNLVRIRESPCSNKICVSRGWMNNPGQWAACLPNMVMVSIEGKARGDVDAFNL